MGRKILSHRDLAQNELQNATAQRLGAAPGSPVEAQFYYDTGSKKFKGYNGTTWEDFNGAGGGGGDVSSIESDGVDNELVLFSGSTGKSIKAATLSGIVKSTAGVVSAATAGTDYTTSDSTGTFTNKTFDANGTGNSITNIETANLAAGVLKTDTNLTGATDTEIPSALAVKTYADNLLSSNDAMVFKGGIDASTNPDYPAGDAGDTHKITVAGKIGGASGIDVTVGDTIYCTVDSSAAGDHATVGANWTIVQANVDAASDTTQGLVELATAAEAEARTDTTRAVTPVSLASFPVIKAFDIGDGSTTAIAVNHNLGTKDVIYSIRQNSDDAFVDVEAVATDTNNLTLTFTVAPTTNAIRVVVQG